MSSPIPILYEDERLLVVAKPPGVLSVRGSGERGKSLPELLAEQGRRVLAVHRLDRDVSGAIVFARDEETRAELEEAFRARAVAKTYWALVVGRLPRPEGVLRFPILKEGQHARVSARGAAAETRYRTLCEHAATTEVEIELVTGRYNQIRLHFAHVGAPLAGERKYARGAADPLRAPRLALHAWRIAFPHPWSGQTVRAEAPLPAALLELREKARSRPS